MLNKTDHSSKYTAKYTAKSCYYLLLLILYYCTPRWRTCAASILTSFVGVFLFKKFEKKEFETQRERQSAASGVNIAGESRVRESRVKESGVRDSRQRKIESEIRQTHTKCQKDFSLLKKH